MTLKNIDSNVSSQRQCSGHIGHPQTSLGSLQWDYFPLMESRSNENNLWIIQDSTDILSRNRCLYLSILIFQHFEDDKENFGHLHCIGWWQKSHKIFQNFSTKLSARIASSNSNSDTMCGFYVILVYWSLIIFMSKVVISWLSPNVIQFKAVSSSSRQVLPCAVWLYHALLRLYIRGVAVSFL